MSTSLSSPTHPATQRHGLPLILSGQASKHITHNEALCLVDALMHPRILGEADTPPASPAFGDVWQVGSDPTDTWEPHAGRLAVYTDGGWHFADVPEGAVALWEDGLRVHDGQAWAIVAPDRVDRFGIGTNADATNRLAVKSDAVLLSAPDGNGDIRVNLNREGIADTATVNFQTNYATGVEFGVAGDGHFRVKVSDDGASFRTLMQGDPVTGYCGFGERSPIMDIDVNRDAPDGFVGVGIANLSTDPTAIAGFQVVSGASEMNFYQTTSGLANLITTGSLITYRAAADGGTHKFVARGSEALSISEIRVRSLKPLQLPTHTVAGLPAFDDAGTLIYLSDGVEGPGLAFSDGLDWRWAASGALVA